MPMAETRHSHTATMLQDGRVLIAGGYGAGTVTLDATEIYDPRTGSFTPGGRLAAARAGHVAMLLRDGTVLLAGGVGPDWTFLASAEVHDPITGRSQKVGDMTVARESHVAVALADGRVLIVGGHRGRRAEMVLHASTEIFGNVGYTNARFGAGATSGGVDVSDNRVPNTPNYTAALGANLQHPLNDTVTLFGRAEAVFYGAMEYDDANTARQDAYSLVNLRGGFRTRFFVAEAWMKNAFDTRYVPVAFPYQGFAPSGFVGEMGRPRTTRSCMASR